MSRYNNDVEFDTYIMPFILLIPISSGLYFFEHFPVLSTLAALVLLCVSESWLWKFIFGMPIFLRIVDWLCPP